MYWNNYIYIYIYSCGVNTCPFCVSCFLHDPQNTIYIFISQNIQWIVREYLYIPLSNRVEWKKYDIYQNILHMFLSIIISKFATKYHYSSTIINGIGWAHKFIKKGQQTCLTNNRSNASSSNSHAYYNFNKNIDTF